MLRSAGQYRANIPVRGAIFEALISRVLAKLQVPSSDVFFGCSSYRTSQLMWDVLLL